jgi:hypothetical protein
LTTATISEECCRFELLHAIGEVLVSRENFAKLEESANDDDVHLHGAITGQDRGELATPCAVNA